MKRQLNQLYLENYVKNFTNKVCDGYFNQFKYITGPQIVQLTASEQINFFVIKALFAAWQEELEKLKASPFFDYRDKAVHDALKDFMNVLSRTIKIDRENFEPLLIAAVIDSIYLATDPVLFFSSEIEKCPEEQLNNYFKENKRYFKWHSALVENLIDRAALGFSHKAYIAALKNNYEQQISTLRTSEELLTSLNKEVSIDFNQLFLANKEDSPKELPVSKEMVDSAVEGKRSSLFTPIVEQKKEVPSYSVEIEVKEVAVIESSAKSEATKPLELKEGKLDAQVIWSRFESEEYGVMKMNIKELNESIGINQRFMFTKELFDGNPDLLRHALKSIDQCETFNEAINLLNLRYVDELKWDIQSDALDEFLQLIFRKFDKRG
ncbi:hypothetical protein [Mongoliitalea lutea]|uniref:Uncharacterized protein n=1 Tax=Mongoliitalea lutea TaxID=849756 RepID=A0A8J3CYB8_9BACT|nr:hypothetical protein [Mongoliitalea lutea]GHB42220.1 hypothetical protein GCM10008106_24040 [Mongoliitalea lutea]